MIKKYIIPFLILILIFWVGGFCFFAWKINNFPINTKQKTDAVIALTGGKNRISEAVKILNSGFADSMFISGVGKNISLSDIKKTQHISLPPHANIEIGHLASNTIGNAKETQIWISDNNIDSIRLVTSNYHIFRSVIEFKEQCPNLKIIPHPVFSENVEKKWWTSWQTCSLIFKEYNKLIYAFIRTKINK